MTPAGLPHSDISGSMLVCSSPKLFAAYHVLRRPPIPRHPSCALSSLTTKKLFRSFTDESANVTSSLPVSQHKLLAFEYSYSNTSCRIFFKTFSLIVNQPASFDAYISTPFGVKTEPKVELVEPKGLEPSTSCLQSRCSSQLSYGPFPFASIIYKYMVGVPGFEPGTSSLSGTRSNQLSYTPLNDRIIRRSAPQPYVLFNQPRQLKTE